MRTIETHWNNYHFRSRLEAQWAVFFDTVGIAYQYEPEGYDLSQTICPSDEHNSAECVCRERANLQQKNAWYLPDFFLSNVGLRGYQGLGLFFEVKGIANEKDDDRCVLLGALTGRPVILAALAPFVHGDQGEGLTQLSPWWDNYMIFMRCPACRHIKIEYPGGSYWECPKCTTDIPFKDPWLEKGVRQARQARF